MTHPDQKARMDQLNDDKRKQQIQLMIDQLNKLKKIDNVPDGLETKVRVKTLETHAIIPTRTNLSDAGWDLYATHDVLIRGGERQIVKTGIALQIPDEWVGLIWPRSGLSAKKGIDVLAGVVDSGYRGEIMVCLYNTNKALPLFQDDNIDVQIKKGDRIAQILFQRVPDVEMVLVDELTESDRGDDGFGSSGS